VQMVRGYEPETYVVDARLVQCLYICHRSYFAHTRTNQRTNLLLDLVDQVPDMLWGACPKGKVVSRVDEICQPLLCLEDFGQDLILFPFAKSRLADLVSEKGISIASMVLIGNLQFFLDGTISIGCSQSMTQAYRVIFRMSDQLLELVVSCYMLRFIGHVV
jgi:hypothetical protein